MSYLLLEDEWGFSIDIIQRLPKNLRVALKQKKKVFQRIKEMTFKLSCLRCKKQALTDKLPKCNQNFIAKIRFLRGYTKLQTQRCIMQIVFFIALY